MLPGRWRAQWDLEGDTVRFDRRPVLPAQVPHPPPVVTAETRWKIPLAVDEDGATVTWHLRGTGPHLLVIGKTGQGKTVLMNGVVMELAVRSWPVWICDPKRIEFLGLRGWPNVQIVATSVPDQVVVINQAWTEMEHRYALIESGQAVEEDFEPLILVLDEYRDFYGIVGEWYAGVKVTGMPTRCPVLEKLSSLVRKGRSARVHVVLGLQRPDADVLGGEMRDNFGTRVSLGPLSPQGAMMMWESAHLGVALPRGIAGRGTAVSDDARPVEVQTYWTPDPRRAAYAGVRADLALLEQLRPAHACRPRLVVRLDEELLTTPDAKGRSQEWAAVAAGELVAVSEPASSRVTAQFRWWSRPHSASRWAMVSCRDAAAPRQPSSPPPRGPPQRRPRPSADFRAGVLTPIE
jgi:DNA segregation ATPase FtsK/SpoIIIE, S-DNA-T family